MDPLTHTATGLFLSRAGLNRFTPYATPILLLAANAPDVDIVTSLGGPLTYLKYHRHLTHAIPLLPVMALLPVLVVRLFARRERLNWSGAYLISLVAVASHLALDFTNMYGIRLWLPFSPQWYQLSITSVIDFWLWAMIALALGAPLLGRLVSSEIGAQARGTPGRGLAIAALAFFVLYNAGHAVLHARAVAVLESRLYQGSPPLRVAALPHLADPWRFRGLVETREFYSVHEMNLRGDFDPAGGRIFYKPEAAPALEAAARTTTFRDFLAFAQFSLWRILPATEPENAVMVQVMDMRFGSPLQPAFVATAVVDARLQVLRSWFTFGSARPR
jgi:inner membrane protein